MSDQYLEASQQYLDAVIDALHNDNHDCHLVIDAIPVIEAWVGDRDLYEKVPDMMVVSTKGKFVRMSVEGNDFQDTSNYDGTFDGGTDETGQYTPIREQCGFGYHRPDCKETGEPT